jgi:hypothetical protein
LVERRSQNTENDSGETDEFNWYHRYGPESSRGSFSESVA